MTVQVEKTAKTVKDAIVVPAAAVFKNPEGGGNYVLLAGTDDKAHLKKVQVGIRNTDAAQIVSGINAQDPVITTGGYAVPDGTKIKVEKPDAAEKEGAAGDAKKDKDDADDKKGAAGDVKKDKDDADDKKGGAAAKPDDKDKE